MYYRPVRKKRSACLTDEELANLQAAARLHAADIQKANTIWQAPVVPDRILCWWCRAYHRPDEVEQCMALHRPLPPASSNGTSSSSAKMGSLLAEFSEVWEFLSSTRYADGAQRQTGQFSLRCEHNGLRGTLTDPSSSSYCSLTMESLDELLLAFEIGLKANSLDWRKSSFSKGKR